LIISTLTFVVFTLSIFKLCKNNCGLDSQMSRTDIDTICGGYMLEPLEGVQTLGDKVPGFVNDFNAEWNGHGPSSVQVDELEQVTADCHAFETAGEDWSLELFPPPEATFNEEWACVLGPIKNYAYTCSKYGSTQHISSPKARLTGGSSSPSFFPFGTPSIAVFAALPHKLKEFGPDMFNKTSRQEFNTFVINHCLPGNVRGNSAHMRMTRRLLKNVEGSRRQTRKRDHMKLQKCRRQGSNKA
jgi:hypothetical protein